MFVVVAASKAPFERVAVHAGRHVPIELLVLFVRAVAVAVLLLEAMQTGRMAAWYHRRQERIEPDAFAALRVLYGAQRLDFRQMMLLLLGRVVVGADVLGVADAESFLQRALQRIPWPRIQPLRLAVVRLPRRA